MLYKNNEFAFISKFRDEMLYKNDEFAFIPKFHNIDLSMFMTCHCRP